MPEISKDVVALLGFLLPGFLVAWVFYALTSHQKPSQSERVIQALIFTLFVKLIVSCTKIILEWAGYWIILGSWNELSELVCSLLTALVLGGLITLMLNTGHLHAWLRKLGITKRGAQPSEWCEALDIMQTEKYFLVLHLNDGRRLYGWPEVWPSDPEKGHFYLTFASWLRETDNQTPSAELTLIEGIVINAQNIKFIEFVSSNELNLTNVNSQESHHD